MYINLLVLSYPFRSQGKVITKKQSNFTSPQCFLIRWLNNFEDFSEFGLIYSLRWVFKRFYHKSTKEVILCFTIGDVHQFIINCLIPLDTWIFCHDFKHLRLCSVFKKQPTRIYIPDIRVVNYLILLTFSSLYILSEICWDSSMENKLFFHLQKWLRGIKRKYVKRFP